MVQARTGRGSARAALRQGREPHSFTGPGPSPDHTVRSGRDRRLMGRPGAPWKRVVLKVSGEALASKAADEVIDGRVVERLAKEIAEAWTEFGTEIAVVIGGGNI